MEHIITPLQVYELFYGHGDVEPQSTCPECGEQMATAWDRCAVCQARNDEALAKLHADDPRQRG